MAVMPKFIIFATVLAAAGLFFSFVYQPKGATREGRMARITRRVRIVGYAYVAAILISAGLRLLAGWA